MNGGISKMIYSKLIEWMKLYYYRLSILYHVLLISCVGIIVVKQGTIIEMYGLTQKIMTYSLDYDLFRELKLSKEVITEVKAEWNKNPDKDMVEYLTYLMFARGYDLQNNSNINKEMVFQELQQMNRSEVFEELYGYYNSILSDIKYFPIPEQKEKTERIAFDNSWNAARTFGGNRKHEGTDIMTSNNVRGFFPVISVSDGIVEKIGWLNQGGNRVGVRAPGGAYFYYAHMYNYAPGITEGSQVIAGQLLGFMGDSGYGEEGTIGEFDVHLHFGIYINSKEGEMSVNPYWILKYLEDYKLTYTY